MAQRSEVEALITKPEAGGILLHRLRVHLRLGPDEIGRMLGATGKTVAAWERGEETIPEREVAELTAADEALSRLLRMFRPGRLPQVIRREADLFEGESALAWILDGRIREVADRYDHALTYQA